MKQAPLNKHFAGDIIARILNDTDCKTPMSTSHEIIQSLEEEGFLAPETDLPEPSYFVTECDERYPVWEALKGFSVEADPYNRDLYIQSSYGQGEPFSLAEFRTVIRYLQAAENYMEEN